MRARGREVELVVLTTIGWVSRIAFVKRARRAHSCDWLGRVDVRSGVHRERSAELCHRDGLFIDTDEITAQSTQGLLPTRTRLPTMGSRMCLRAKLATAEEALAP